jgi:hypothetical protein
MVDAWAGTQRALRWARTSQPAKSLRVVALLATYNEARFIENAIQRLAEQGIDVYLIDNQSTDGTLDLAKRHLGAGLAGFESLPRDGTYRWRDILRRKEELAYTLEADWFLHVDADEVRPPPHSEITVAQAIGVVQRLGYNAIDFQEYTFVPTREAPDHDHSNYERTMRWYYPFRNMEPHLVRAWRKQPGVVSLAASGGHEVQFPGRLRYPDCFPMRHYLFLSAGHLQRKYGERNFAVEEVAAGWHTWRAHVTRNNIDLPSQRDLRSYLSDEELDSEGSWTRHWVDQQVSRRQAATPLSTI